MKNKSFLIIIIQSLLILILIWLLILLSKDELLESNELEDEVIVDYTLNEDGLIYVVLSEAVEKNSYIETSLIKKTNFKKEISSHGKIINTNELIESKKLIKKNNFLINKINSQIQEETEHLEKFIKLNKDNKNISDTVVHEQEIIVNNLKNEYGIIKNDLETLKNSIQYNWGEYFRNLITKKSIDKHCLFINKCSLAQITIDQQKFIGEIPKTVSLISTNNQINYLGEYLGPSPRLEKAIQGNGFYFLIRDFSLPSESKMIVKLAEKNSNNNYLFIPKNAVIWSHGKPWVYIREADSPKFLRKPLKNPHETENGWLVIEDNIIENQLLVTDGAQLLLSEEFKYQIKNENED